MRNSKRRRYRSRERREAMLKKETTAFSIWSANHQKPPVLSTQEKILLEWGRSNERTPSQLGRGRRRRMAKYYILKNRIKIQQQRRHIL